MPTESTKRALIIKIGALGDAIMALPLARELAKQGYEVSWLGGSDLRPILALVPEISRLLYVNEKALFGGSKLRAVFEIFRTWKKLIGHGSGDVYLLHRDSRYKLLIPFWMRSRIHAIPRESRRHHTFDYTRLAFPSIEDNALKFTPYTLAPLKVARVRQIAVFAGGAKNSMRDDPLRRWPVENYVRLTELLLSNGHAVSICGGPSDKWLEPHFAHLRARLEWRVGTQSIAETIKYLQATAVAVSHDTGPIHFASMADCPAVTIFGSTNSEWVAPLNFKHLIVEREQKLPCQPCYDGRDYRFCTKNICISEIPAEVVAAKIEIALTKPR